MYSWYSCGCICLFSLGRDMGIYQDDFLFRVAHRYNVYFVFYIFLSMYLNRMALFLRYYLRKMRIHCIGAHLLIRNHLIKQKWGKSNAELHLIANSELPKSRGFSNRWFRGFVQCAPMNNEHSCPTSIISQLRNKVLFLFLKPS